MKLLRPLFAPGDILSSGQLSLIVDYVDALVRLQNLEGGTGIRRGLQVRADDHKRDTVHVSPGFAVDSLGRAVVIDEEQVLPYKRRFDGVVAAGIAETPMWPHPVLSQPEGEPVASFSAVELAPVVSVADALPENYVLLATIRGGELVS